MANDTLEMMKGQRIADPAEGGLGDALDRFFEETPATPAVATLQQEPPKQEAPKQEAPKETPKETPKEEEKPAVTPIVDEIDLEDFSMGKEALSDASGGTQEAFDEGAFDKETEKLSEGLEAKAGDKFKALRAELKEAKQKTVTPDVQKKLEELEMKAAEAEGLRKKVDELANVSAKTRMESQPEFVDQVKKPADGLYKEVEQMAQRYEGDAGFLWKLVTNGNAEEQGKLVEEHLGEFSKFDQVQVARMIKDWSGILDRRDSLLENAQKYIDGIDARQAEESQKVLSENRSNVQSILKGMWEKRKNVIPGLVDEDGKETTEFKNMFAESMALDFTRATAHDLALAAHSGVLVKHLARQLSMTRKQLAELEKESGRTAAATPGTGAALNNGPAPTSNQKTESFRDKFLNADLV